MQSVRDVLQSITVVARARNRTEDAALLQRFFERLVFWAGHALVTESVTGKGLVATEALQDAWEREKAQTVAKSLLRHMPWYKRLYRYILIQKEDYTVQQSLLLSETVRLMRILHTCNYIIATAAYDCSINMVAIERHIAGVLIHHKVCVDLLLAQRYDNGSMLYRFPKELLCDILRLVLVRPVEINPTAMCI